MKFGLQIEPTNRCNLSCYYCTRPQFIKKEGDMDYNLFFAFVNRDMKFLQDSIRGNVSLSGWGEPLLHKDLPLMIESLSKGINIPTGLTTNTVLLTESLSERLLYASIAHLAVSVDHAPNKKISLVERFEGKVQLNANVIIRDMIPDLLGDFARRTWFLAVKFDIINLIPFHPKRQANEKELVDETIEEIMLASRKSPHLKGWMPQIISPYHQPSFKHRAYELLRKGLTKTCTAPIFINWQGIVYPCCLLTHSQGWGNIFLESLEEIVKRMFKARRQYAHFCQKCEYWH